MTNLIGSQFPAGHIDGFVFTYNSTTVINTPGGFCPANGKQYTSCSAATHTMTSLAAGFDHHYLYIDDSASTAPVAVIIDSTTEPTWDTVRNGWYNGDDRMVFEVISKDGAAEIATFASYCAGGKNIRTEYGRTTLPNMSTNMNPSASWQICNTNDGDVITPVMAIAIKIIMGNTDTASTVGLYATNKEYGDIETSVINGLTQFFLYDTAVVTQFYFALGTTRKIYISGSNDDDNALNTYLVGYEYSR